MRTDPARHRLAPASVAAMTLALLPLPALAQSTAGLRGTVTDESGAVLPGAGVAGAQPGHGRGENRVSPTPAASTSWRRCRWEPTGSR